MADRINSAGKINVGDYFESCSFHPCLCIEVDESGRNIEGISLIDGHIQNCSAVHCGIRKLTIDEAIEWKSQAHKRSKTKRLIISGGKTTNKTIKKRHKKQWLDSLRSPFITAL